MHLNLQIIESARQTIVEMAALTSQLTRDDVTKMAPPDLSPRNRCQQGTKAHLGFHLLIFKYRQAKVDTRSPDILHVLCRVTRH